MNGIKAGEPVGLSSRRKSHCPHGHAYTPENTYQMGRARYCRQCHRQSDQHRAGVYVAQFPDGETKELSSRSKHPAPTHGVRVKGRNFARQPVTFFCFAASLKEARAFADNWRPYTVEAKVQMVEAIFIKRPAAKRSKPTATTGAPDPSP